MPIIDTHIHFFPDHIAERALLSLAKTANATPCTTGTKADSLRLLQESGVNAAVALPIATNPLKHAQVNTFAARAQQIGLISFGSVHPDAPDAISELERIKHLGLRGVKLHPDYQDFFVDDPRIFPIYQEAERLALPIVFHVGYDPISPQITRCTPERLCRVADAFPYLALIAAHMGGIDASKNQIVYLSKRNNVWFDTALAYQFMSPEVFADLARAVGVDRIFFASDLPWASPCKMSGWLEASPLETEEKEAIRFRNASQFFDIDFH